MRLDEGSGPTKPYKKPDHVMDVGTVRFQLRPWNDLSTVLSGFALLDLSRFVAAA